MSEVAGIDRIFLLVYFVASLVPAVVLHEVSHGWVANRLGDHTAKMAGRLTLNPIKHVDPFGTVILPAFLIVLNVFTDRLVPIFGYAKPVPVTPQNLNHPDRQMMWISLAGPLTNLGLAVMGALALRVVGPIAEQPAIFLGTWVLVNAFLMVFNLFPIPPLDGSKVLARYLPGRARDVYRSWEPYGALFLLVIFFVLPSQILGFVYSLVDVLFSFLVGA
jgi:Zn-dependent protease